MLAQGNENKITQANKNLQNSWKVLEFRLLYNGLLCLIAYHN